jgi:hypothetical protein
MTDVAAFQEHMLRLLVECPDAETVLARLREDLVGELPDWVDEIDPRMVEVARELVCRWSELG